jgi:hypothetical protein
MPVLDVEDKIAAVVASVVGAHAVRRDLGGHSIRDFDLHFPDGHLEPLEITSYNDAAALQTWGRIEALNRPDKKTGRRRPTPLRRHWIGSVRASFDDGSGGRDPYPLRERITTIERALCGLEAAGIDEFDATTFHGASQALHDIRFALLDAGVEHVIGRDSAPEVPPGFYPGASVGGITTADAVTSAIEETVNRADNRKKLSEPPGAPLRHLFIDFAASSGVAFNAVDHGMTGPVPTLPPPITTIWIATNYGRIFRTTPPADWEEHRVLPEVWNQPEKWLGEDLAQTTS